MAVENEIKLGQLQQQTKLEFLLRWACLAAALWICLFILPGCDGEVERLQAQAEWQAKMTRAATPKKGELVTIRELAKDRYVVRRYNGGLQETNIIARDE